MKGKSGERTIRRKVKRDFFYIAWGLKFSFLMAFYLVVSLPLRFSRKYKNLWLIAERPDEARDNGYWLYKWIIENQPNVNVRYVLARDSVDYEKMPRKDLIIEPGSAKHYIYYILSSYSISTHMHGACPGKSFVIPFLPLARRKKTVFLQHGIIKDKIKLRGGLDMIVASANQEKALLAASNPKYRDKIYVTGLCRYDGLSDFASSESPRILLVMPTFRKWLRDLGRLKRPNEAFMKTTYFERWEAFVNDERLERLLKRHNLKLIFLPHKEMQELTQCIVSRSKYVKIAKPAEYDVQDLLRRASLLITDFSSVFFDFAYMEKPVAFYQFDKEDFFDKHYGYSGESYPFGNIYNDKERLIDCIAQIADNGYQMPPKYKEEVDVFFEYKDTNNCSRVFEAIKRLT